MPLSFLSTNIFANANRKKWYTDYKKDDNCTKMLTWQRNIKRINMRSIEKEILKKQIVSELIETGCVILSELNKFTHDTVISIKNKISKHPFDTLFGDEINLSNIGDPNRLVFRSVDHEEIIKISNILIDLFEEYDYQHTNLILSKPGGLEQVAHVDYDMYRYNNKKSNFVNGIISIDGPSTIKIWPGSHRLFDIEADGIVNKIKPVYVTLQPGDALFFVDGFVHAGCTYTKENMRLYIPLKLNVNYKSENDVRNITYVKNRGNVMVHQLNNHVKANIENYMNNVGAFKKTVFTIF